MTASRSSLKTGHADAGIYERRFVPLAFDFLIAAVFMPFGGIRTLRADAVSRLNIQPGMKVLEPGCGTGGITRLLLARGADVTAIDGSRRMLARARRRAPGARFEQQRLESLEIAGKHDVVLFAFVLHELPRESRARAIAAAREALSPTGVVAVLDYTVPRTGAIARAWRTFLLRLEPPSVRECIEQGYDAELEDVGLAVFARHELARGTAALVLARREG